MKKKEKVLNKAFEKQILCEPRVKKNVPELFMTMKVNYIVSRISSLSGRSLELPQGEEKTWQLRELFGNQL